MERLLDKFCPNCGKKYKWYESECADCRVALVDTPPSDAPNPTGTIATVFETDEPGLLALAKLTLEQADIEFVEYLRPDAPLLEGGRIVRGDKQRALVELHVASDDEAAARELLDSLGTETEAVTPPLAMVQDNGESLPTEADADVDLVDVESGRPIGRITRDQFDWLASRLEKESPDDRAFYIDRATLDMLQDQGADHGLLLMLKTAMGDRDGVEIGRK
jgi:hypothetical protein